MIIVAVSGGVDSRVLLEVLREIQFPWQLNLILAHLNHGLRGAESNRDELFVRELGHDLGIPVEVGHLQDLKVELESGTSLQALARKKRYEFLERVRHVYQGDVVALGHTRTDQAETLLLRLIRGAGTGGLSGMPAQRENKIVRPLLGIGRKEILDYARRHELVWMEDGTNSTSLYTRNRIRHEVVPVLEMLNPRIEVALEQLALTMRRDNECLERMVTVLAASPWILWQNGMIRLERSPLLELDTALQYRLLRRLARRLEGVEEGKSRIEYSHVEAGMALVGDPRGTRSLNWPGGLVLTVTSEALWLKRALEEPGESWVGASLKIPGFLALPGNWFLEGRYASLDEFRSGQSAPGLCWLDGDAITLPLCVRYPKRGDRFHPLGAPEETRLSQFFIRQKVPKHERCRTPVVLSGEQIIWVAGRRTAEPAKLTSCSRRVVRLELKNLSVSELAVPPHTC